MTVTVFLWFYHFNFFVTVINITITINIFIIALLFMQLRTRLISPKTLLNKVPSYLWLPLMCISFSQRWHLMKLFKY